MWLEFISSECDKVFDSTNPIPILIHGYAHAVADGRPAVPCFAGPWLKPAFEKMGHRNLEQNIRTMEHLVNLFNDMLSSLCTEDSRLHYVNVRDVLTNDLDKYQSDWNDELHPTPCGFVKVSEVFTRTIDNLNNP